MHGGAEGRGRYLGNEVKREGKAGIWPLSLHLASPFANFAHIMNSKLLSRQTIVPVCDVSKSHAETTNRSAQPAFFEEQRCGGPIPSHLVVPPDIMSGLMKKYPRSQESMFPL